MEIKEGLKYSKEHEWVKVEGETAYVGITDYAQHNLGDIVFVELPEMDAELGKGDVVGVVDSVKAASDIYTPISGTVVEINEELADAPENINNAPYDSWIAKLSVNDVTEVDALMDPQAYQEFCEQEA